MKLLICFIVVLGTGVKATTKTCDLYKTPGSSGCTGGFPFDFQYAGINDVPNSLCRRTYNLRVNLPPGKGGFRCTFYFDVPEQYKYVYSISSSGAATGPTPSSAYIYGRGLDAYIRSRTTSSSTYGSNYWYYNNAHTHTDDNHYSRITYTFENSKLRMSSSAGHYVNMGHPYFWSVTSSFATFYIGLNKRYADLSSRGSGLCKVICSDYSTSISSSPRRRIADAAGRPGQSRVVSQDGPVLEQEPPIDADPTLEAPTSPLP